METDTINSYYYYLQAMKNGFYDKLFFVDKLFDTWKTLVDYGCANGLNAKMLGKIFRDKWITGYDIDPEMITTARWNGETFSNVSFTDQAQSTLEQDVFFTSSTIHELYHYGNQEDVEEFWALVYSSKRKYVCIRDMTYRHKEYPISRELINKIKDGAATLGAGFELDRFISRWGDIDHSRNMMHWLMKYLYFASPNWERELNENYLPVSYEQLILQIPKGWELFYEDVYQLPYLSHIWRRDFGITIKDPTHVKLIIRRK